MKIFWTESAVADLTSIRDGIARDSEYYASEFVNKIIETVENLVEFPMKGRSVPEAYQKDVREIVFHNYRIMYRVEESRIIILTILYSART